jgi:hypothetical protein
MWHEQTGVALSEAAREVLESMCFMDAGEVPDPLPAGAARPSGNPALVEATATVDSGATAEGTATAPSTIAAQVEFRGYWSGRCIVEMTEVCARTITGNFTGVLDPDQVDAVNMIEFICEFANMICGGTITRLRCPGIVTLAPPHLIQRWPEPAGHPAAERWLDTGEGVVRMAFETAGKEARS